MFQTVEPDKVKGIADISAPHTTHCLADGNIMISSIGDAKGNGKGTKHTSGVASNYDSLFYTNLST